MIKDCIWCWTLLSVISWLNISFGVERYFQLYRGQRLHLVLNATFSDIVVKDFIWCWTPLSAISWSNILFGVERHFQLYRGQIFYLVVEETTDLTQSHWQTYFKDEVYRRTLFDLMHILSWKLTMPIIQRTVWKYQWGNQNRRTTTYTYNKDSTLKYRVWAPQGQRTLH